MALDPSPFSWSNLAGRLVRIPKPPSAFTDSFRGRRWQKRRVMSNRDLNTAADNVRKAVEAMRQGHFGVGLDILDGRATSPGDEPWHGPVPVPGYEPSYPYVPPVGQSPVGDYPPPPPEFQPPQQPPGWYADPIDGQGLRWWNGYGWTDQTQ